MNREQSTASRSLVEFGSSGHLAEEDRPRRRAALDEADLERGSIRPSGERLAWVRAKAGLSLSQAAAEMGISKAELSRIENGKRDITEKHLAKCAAAYGVSMGRLSKLLDFDPRQETAVFHIMEPASTPRTRPVPIYGDIDLMTSGPSAAHRQYCTLPSSEGLGPTAYGVRLSGDGWQLGGLEQLLAVVDPEARAVLGDLVVNPFGWNPLIGTAARDRDGTLVLANRGSLVGRLGKVTRPSDLHKVVMLVPGSLVTSLGGH